MVCDDKPDTLQSTKGVFSWSLKMRLNADVGSRAERWIDCSRAALHSAAGDLVLKTKFVRSARAE